MTLITKFNWCTFSSFIKSHIVLQILLRPTPVKCSKKWKALYIFKKVFITKTLRISVFFEWRGSLGYVIRTLRISDLKHWKRPQIHPCPKLKLQLVLSFSSFVHNSSNNEHKNMKLRENICYEMIYWILYYWGFESNL